jgi:hypothetical protein
MPRLLNSILPVLLRIVTVDVTTERERQEYDEFEPK